MATRKSMFGGGESMYYSARKTFRIYPEYKHKDLNNRRSLLASVNSRIGSMKNIFESESLTEDEKILALEIKDKLSKLSDKIKENDKKDKDKKPVLRLKGTGSILSSI